MASVLKVDKLDPQSGTALEIGTSGDTITVPSGATLDISASTLTPPATMPASSGVNLTALNATQLTSGTVPAARLSGVGKIGQVLYSVGNSATTVATTTYSDISLSQAITPSATSSKILIMGDISSSMNATNSDLGFGIKIRRDSTGVFESQTQYHSYHKSTNSMFIDGDRFPFFYLDSPSSTSAITYSVYVGTWISGSVVFQPDSNQSEIVLMEVLA